jgi:heme-degrading monooxygenase HmoA
MPAGETQVVEFVWEFVARAEQLAAFEEHCSKAGPWAALFARCPGYRGTRLIRDLENPRRFLTVNVWDNLESYQAMRRDFSGEYAELDRTGEGFTESERRIGAFEVI